MNDLTNLINEKNDKIKNLELKIVKLKKALKFYADFDKNTTDTNGYEQDCYGWSEEFMGCESWRHDKGDVAKEALEEVENE